MEGDHAEATPNVLVADAMAIAPQSFEICLYMMFAIGIAAHVQGRRYLLVLRSNVVQLL